MKSASCSSGHSSAASPSPPTLPGDDRKRKRMQSNRESARRSRMRKQKQLDDLTAQIAQISKENDEISSSIDVFTQHYVKVEAQNSVLRAQMMELSQRLQSLNQILSHATATASAGGGGGCMFGGDEFQYFGDGFMNSSWNLSGANQQPIMAAAAAAAAAEMFDYYY